MNSPAARQFFLGVGDMSRFLRWSGFLLVFVFCATVGLKCDSPRISSPVPISRVVNPFKHVTKQCVISGRFVTYRNGLVYVDSPKDGLVTARITSKTRIVFHNYVSHERAELKEMQEVRDRLPDAVTLGINGVVEDAIFAVIEE